MDDFFLSFLGFHLISKGLVLVAHRATIRMVYPNKR